MNAFIQKNKNEINKYKLGSDRKNAIALICESLLSDGSGSSDQIDEENIFEDENSSIDFVWNDENESDNVAFVKLLSKDKIKNDAIEKITEMIEYSESNDCRDKIDTAMDNLENPDDCFYKFILINTSNEDIKKTKDVINELQDNLKHKDNYRYQIVNISEIQKNILKNVKNNLYAENGSFKLDKENNILEFHSDNELVNKSIICNISAQSLRDLYKENGNSIFNLNLRFFKKKKDVDEDIKKSIEDPKDFWFLNNGIYIICSDMKIDGAKLNLSHLSIINGGQTTFNISNFKKGQDKLDKDFYIVAKVISIKNWYQGENMKTAFDFANNVAVASNKQKPINNNDLIANDAQVINVKQIYNKFKNWRDGEQIFIESKKGEFASLEPNIKKIYEDKPKSIEFLIQLNYSYSKLMPGVTKSGKAKIYSDKKELNISLKELEEDPQTYTNIVWIHKIFKSIWTKRKKDIEKLNGNTHITNIFKNFDFFFVSLFYILNIYIRLEGDEKINFFNYVREDECTTQRLRNYIKEKKYKWALNLNNLSKNEFADLIFKIFSEHSVEILPEAIKKTNKHDMTPSNFVKTDDNLIYFIREFLRIMKYEGVTAMIEQIIKKGK